MAEENVSGAEQNFETGASTNSEGPQDITQEPAVPESDKQARMWAMFCHLAGLAAYILPLVGNIIAPLIIWQVKKDEHAFVDKHGKEAVNFQISMTLYAAISIPLISVCVGAFLLAAVGIVDLVFMIIAAVKANNGESYRYPVTIRFIK